MKKIHLLLLIVMLHLFCSCNNGKTTNQGTTVGQNQKPDPLELKKLYNEFLLKQSQINVIEYNVNRIDTFVDGNIWNHTGTATLERNNRDTIFKFSFYGKRDDINRENIYIENRHFQIYPETKTFRTENNYGSHVLGAPGGQMVIVDLLNPDTIGASISLQNKDDESFIIKISKNEGGYVITKILTIDKKTFIPKQISKTVINSELNQKSSEADFITNVLIGEQVKNNKLSNMDFLSEYTQETLTVDKSANALIGEKVPEILLRTFDNDTINIRSLESKVVLLDFWEMWCGACLQSLPKVHELSKAYSLKGFITIGIISSNIDAAKIYLGKKEISFLQVQGNTKMEALFKVNSFPRYVLIDKQGIIKHIFYGYSDDIEKKIKSLISI